MKIDNRVFLCLAFPFLFVGFLMIFLAFAGVEWAGSVRVFLVILTIILWPLAVFSMFEETGPFLGYTRIGKTRIDKAKEGDK